MLSAGGVTKEMQKIRRMYQKKKLTMLVDYFSSLCSLIHVSLSLWGFQKQSIDYLFQHLACDNLIQPS